MAPKAEAFLELCDQIDTTRGADSSGNGSLRATMEPRMGILLDACTALDEGNVGEVSR